MRAGHLFGLEEKTPRKVFTREGPEKGNPGYFWRGKLFNKPYKHRGRLGKKISGYPWQATRGLAPRTNTERKTDRNLVRRSPKDVEQLK